jgi:hypothetical protein
MVGNSYFYKEEHKPYNFVCIPCISFQVMYRNIMNHMEFLECQYPSYAPSQSKLCLVQEIYESWSKKYSDYQFLNCIQYLFWLLNLSHSSCIVPTLHRVLTGYVPM